MSARGLALVTEAAGDTNHAFKLLSDARARASRLAAEGAAVALVARRRDRLDSLAAAIRADGGTALVVPADVTSQQQAAGAVEQVAAGLGRLDIVVNNAGIMLLGPALDAPIGEWDQMVALNVQGMLYITHAALPHLVRAAADSPAGWQIWSRSAPLPGGWPGPEAACTTLPSSARQRSARRCARRCSATGCG